MCERFGAHRAFVLLLVPVRFPLVLCQLALLNKNLITFVTVVGAITAVLQVSLQVAFSIENHSTLIAFKLTCHRVSGAFMHLFDVFV